MYNKNTSVYLHGQCQCPSKHTVLLFVFSYYDTKAVFLALGITAVVCIAVTVFCFQTKVGFVCAHQIKCHSVLFFLMCFNAAVGGFLFLGGLHKVPGPFLCPGDRSVRDWHHNNHCAVIQICELRLKTQFRHESFSSFLHCNDCLLFQIPWLHMLYAGIGAIAFTLVRIMQFNVISFTVNPVMILCVSLVPVLV